MVVCQPGIKETAKSKDTMVCTERTSGVERPSQKQVSHFVIAPVAVGSSPAHGKNAVGDFAKYGFGAVPHRGQIGYHPDIPEHNRYRGVCRHRENVP